MTAPKKTRLLVASDENEVSRQLMQGLEELEDVWLETFPSFDAAVRSCRYLDPPDAALAVVTQEVPGILELMAALNSSSRTVPLFALVTEKFESTRATAVGPPFTLLSADHPVEDLLEQIISTIEAATAAPCQRRGIDFLLAVILSRRSITLDLTVAATKIHIEFVGGDIWNAYAGSLDNYEALATVLLQPAEDVEFQVLHAIPGERQIALPGLETLNQVLNQAPHPAHTKSFSPEQESVETQEVDLVLTRAEFLGEKDLSGTSAPSAPAPMNESSTGDPFDTLLAKGIQAALARDYQKAVESFQEALVHRPGDTRAEFNLGRVQRQIGG